VLSVSCVLYERACALRWQATFDHLNPQYRDTEQPLVRDWLFLGRRPPVAGQTASHGMLSAGRGRFRLADLLAGKPRLLIFEGADLRGCDDAAIAGVLQAYGMGTDQVSRIAVDRASRRGDRLTAPRGFLSAWRARHVAFAVVDAEQRIRLLGWRWGRLEPADGIARGMGEAEPPAGYLSDPLSSRESSERSDQSS